MQQTNYLTRVAILVQGANEMGVDFSTAINNKLESIEGIYPLSPTPIVTFTSDQCGRTTAHIQYFTDRKICQISK